MVRFATIPEALQTHPQTACAHFFHERRSTWYAHLHEAVEAGYNGAFVPLSRKSSKENGERLLEYRMSVGRHLISPQEADIAQREGSQVYKLDGANLAE